MPNVVKIAVCPYYSGESNKSITCEGVNHSFGSLQERFDYMDRYCCGFDYGKCEWAREYERVYERIEKGADMERTELEAQIRALEKESRHKATLLGKAEKRIERQQKKIDELRAVNQSFLSVNDSLEQQKKHYYKRARAAEEQLAKNDEAIYSEIAKLTEIYEQRLAYLIDRYCPNGLPEREIEAWAKDKAIALAGRYTEEGLVWESKWKYAAEETEGTGAAEADTN